MKRKAILAVLTAAIMALSAVGAFALDYYVPENAISITARFFEVTSNEEGNEFTMVSEDGAYLIYVTDATVIYFEDFVPLSDECDELTQMVRDVLFGRTVVEVLEGRNMVVTFVDAEAGQIEPISIKILFEIAVHLPEAIDLELDIDLGDYCGIVALPDVIDLEDLDLDADLDGEYIGIVTLPGEIDWEYVELEYLGPIVLNGEIVVNYEGILEDAPLPFLHAEYDNLVMVPLRVVAEALGYDVHWYADTRSIGLGVAIHVWIDRAVVYIGRMAPIEISAAPVVLDGITFVPIDLFRALGYTAYTFEGQVVIAAYSDMR